MFTKFLEDPLVSLYIAAITRGVIKLNEDVRARAGSIRLRLSYLKHQLSLEYLRDQLSLTLGGKDVNLREDFAASHRVVVPWMAGSGASTDLDLIAKFYLQHGREELRKAGVALDG